MCEQSPHVNKREVLDPVKSLLWQTLRRSELRHQRRAPEYRRARPVAFSDCDPFHGRTVWLKTDCGLQTTALWRSHEAVGYAVAVLVESRNRAASIDVIADGAD
jgi:hypothetical protein